MLKDFFGEFKDFAMRGNVMDLAVGVIIGGAFQKIVDSLVKDMLSPVIGLFTRCNFDDLKIKLFEEAVTIKYGSFITALINFVIMAFVIFCLVKGLNAIANIGRKEEEPVVTTKICPFCKSEINLEATKCPFCASELPEEEEEA